MLPLVGDLAPPHRRAAALSIVSSGLIGGILIARVLSGIIANYSSWRNVYWMGLGVQYLLFVLLWFYMPDYPSVNPSGLNYFQILWTILVMITKHPVLVQACLTAIFPAATFTSFWTTLTGLLSGSPYHYAPLEIGLFGLIGLGAMAMGPFYAHLVTDRFVPLFSVIVGQVVCLAGICIGTYVGTFSVAGPILQALLNDLGLQTAQIANRTAIYSVEPRGRNRVNTAFMVSVFVGQLMGTAVGNRVYAEYGWVATGSVSVGFMGASLLVCASRGPWEDGWIGWKGGWSVRKKDKNSADGKTTEANIYNNNNNNQSGDTEKGESGVLDQTKEEGLQASENEDVQLKEKQPEPPETPTALDVAQKS
jgi:predicted MFS family arabinose efflux permease